MFNNAFTVLELCSALFPKCVQFIGVRHSSFAMVLAIGNFLFFAQISYFLVSNLTFDLSFLSKIKDKLCLNICLSMVKMIWIEVDSWFLFLGYCSGWLGSHYAPEGQHQKIIKIMVIIIEPTMSLFLSR